MKLIYLHKVVYRAVLLTASGETITIAKRDRKGGEMHCGKYCNRLAGAYISENSTHYYLPD